MTETIDEDEARAAALVAEILTEYLAPPPRMTVTEWAEKHRVLSAKDSAEPGPYRVARTPYALEPQDALSPYSQVEEVVLMWGAQTSKTTVGGNWVGSVIDMQPGPLMIVQPTIDTAKRFSRQRLSPMIEESPALKRKVSENRSRDDSNTILLKEYAGGFMVVAGANSAAGLRSMPIRDIFFDEIDAYPLDVDGEGDPISLAEARQSTFSRRKRLKTSTPTLKGMSRIESAFIETDQRFYHVPCPHCGELQALEWGADKPYGLKWHKDADGQPLPETAHYVCKHHGCIIEEHSKTEFLRCVELGGQARWVPINPAGNPRKRGYHLSSLYSPLGFLSWRELVEEWHHANELAAFGDASELRAFVNTRLAETWEDSGDRVAEHELTRRVEDYALGTVPFGCLALSAGIDVQPDRLHLLVWGWGRGEEAWLIDRKVISGSPEEQATWDALDEILRAPFRHASGSHIMIGAAAVDSGGHNTQAVYNYTRARMHRHVLAIKGSSQPNKPILGKPSDIEVNHRGVKIKSGAKLWPIGTDTAKALIYGRLRLPPPGAGCFHFPAAVPGEFFEQLTAERMVTKYIKGHPRHEWVKQVGRRNEDLDCTVYAYAAALYLGINRWRQAEWDKIEAKIQPQVRDLFSQQAQPAPTPRAEQIEPDHIEQPLAMVPPIPTKPGARRAPVRSGYLR